MRKVGAQVDEKEAELRFLTDEYQKLKGLSRSQAHALTETQNQLILAQQEAVSQKALFGDGQ